MIDVSTTHIPKIFPTRISQKKRKKKRKQNEQKDFSYASISALYMNLNTASLIIHCCKCQFITVLKYWKDIIAADAI